MKKIFLVLGLLAGAILLTSCYSVFNGGTGGVIVDAESTSNPKAGIPYVNIYAYTDKSTRDSDFKKWKEGTVFAPSHTYYGHTTTDVNGNFSISNIVWKETRPDFGKDADYTTIYLLYFHENFGLTKDQTVITSNSTSDTVYAELTAIRKTTALDVNIYDVASSGLTGSSVLVTVSVPQSTDTITASPIVYEQIISGSGIIYISYPRWKNDADKTAKIENTPEISIYYSQSGDRTTWKACANKDNEAQNYAFLADNFIIKKTIQKSPYSISLYGKSMVFEIPSVRGTYGDTSSSASDGKIISMKAKAADGTYSIDCGETTTFSQVVGTSPNLTHGNFQNLGNGYYWRDSSYTEKYSTIDVKFFVDGVATSVEKTLRTDTNSYNFNIQ